MKIAIIAGINSDYTALRAILQDIESKWGSCILVALGNMIGAGSKPVETLQEIRRSFQYAVRELGERRFLDPAPDFRYGSPYTNQGIALAKKECPLDLVEWVRSLPEYVQLANLILHSSGFPEELDFCKHLNWPEKVTMKEYLRFLDYLAQQKLNYVSAGGSPHVYIPENNVIPRSSAIDCHGIVDCHGDVDFKVLEGGCTISALAAYGSPPPSRGCGYLIYEPEIRTFHMRWVKMETSDSYYWPPVKKKGPLDSLKELFQRISPF